MDKNGNGAIKLKKEKNVLISVRNLVKHYPLRGGVFSRQVGKVKAVDNVSFQVSRGETIGLVGESGCGKSTLARTMIRLEEPTSGSVYFRGKNLTSLSRKEFFPIRREIQMIFQDPYSSLNPRMTVGELIMDPLTVHRIGNRRMRSAKVDDLLVRVGLSPDMKSRYPHEFSGGQRQRVGVARALTLEPKLVIADEPVSALDVSVRSQVLNLLVELKKEFDLTYIFISHDLSVVEYISDTLAIMYLGKIMEIGPSMDIYRNPRHPYTRVLLEAIPVPDPSRKKKKSMVKGEPPSAVNPPPGCSFHPRCPFSIEECSKVIPHLEDTGSERLHLCACIRKDEI